MITAAGAQHIESGIHRGLVIRQSKINTKHRAIRISTTLDCKIISSRKISENRENFNANLAVCRTLKWCYLSHKGYFFFE